MTKSGTISLCRRSGEIVDVRYYQSPSHRHSFLNKWARIYAAAFNGCYLLISPNTDENLIWEDGTNKALRYQNK